MGPEPRQSLKTCSRQLGNIVHTDERREIPNWVAMLN